MPNELPLLPPSNQRKHLDKTMISLPSDFIHIAHIGAKTPSEIENIRNSDNVIEAVNEVSYYIKPSSSNNTLRSVKNERVGLDDAFPARRVDDGEEIVRSYENQPTSHQYMNVLPVRPSRKAYRAPAPPLPPPRELKPSLIYEETSEESEEPTAPVVFRSISKGISVPPLPPPKINTAKRMEAPKPNSVILERPEELGAFNFGLDDFIPIAKQTSPLKTLSPLHRPIAIPKDDEETPILTAASPSKWQDNDYMSTIRSTSAQGREILDDLDDWLDELDDDDREKLSTISTDESGYPTLALERDRKFMKHLVEKYELGVEPETIKLRKKKAPAPRLPVEALTDTIPPFSSRPVSMPPNRPPPSYDAPSFDAPIYESTLLNGRALTKQNALDLRSSDEGGMSPAIARFLDDKRIKSATMPLSIGRMTTSSGFTDVSTTSSRSHAPSEDAMETVEQKVEVEVAAMPVPKPRTKLSLSSEPLIEEKDEEEKEIEHVVTETTTTTIAKCEIKDVEDQKEEQSFVVPPVLGKNGSNGSKDEEEDNQDNDDDDETLIVTRF
uniref:CRIB domain-containing protein n=1 Tax=Caenorhabditis japonica TaxID=281687 RepID=A0A8R1HMI4_CAEJA